MAISFVASVATQTSGATVLSVTKPAGVVEGDLLLIFVTAYNTTIIMPGGQFPFTGLDENIAGSQSATHTASSGWRLASANEPATWDVTFGTSTWADAICIALRGTSRYVPIGNHAVLHNSAGYVTSMTAPTLPVNSAIDATVYAYTGIDSAVAGATTTTMPGGLSNNLTSNNPNIGDALGVGWGINVTAPGAATAGTAVDYVNFAVDLQPLSVPVPQRQYMPPGRTPAAGRQQWIPPWPGAHQNPDAIIAPRVLATQTRLPGIRTATISNGFGTFSSTSQPGATWRPYSDNSPFNTQLASDPVVLGNSQQMVAKVMSVGAPGFTIQAPDTSSDFEHPTYWSQVSDPWFIVSSGGHGNADGLKLQIPDLAKAAAGADGHMVVVDQVSGWEWDFWQVTSKPAGGTFASPATIACSAAGRVDITGPGTMNTAAGADAANTGLMAGEIRYAEIAAGLIPHALFLVVSCTAASYVYPASGLALTCANQTDAPPDGQLFQLTYTDAEIAATPWPGWLKTIAYAAAHYGMYVCDTGGGSQSISLYFESGSTYTSFSLTDPFMTFAAANLDSYLTTSAGKYYFDISAIDWTNRLRALAPPNQIQQVLATTTTFGVTRNPYRSTSDSANGSDAAVRSVQPFIRTTSDAAAGTDAPVRVAAHPRTTADTAAGTDTTVRSALSDLRTTSDSGAGTDAAVRSIVSFVRTTSDTAAGTDAATRTAAHPRTAADVGAGTDAATRGSLGDLRTTSDVVNGSDIASRAALSDLRATTDAAAGSDVAARSAIGFIRTTSDTGAGSDAATRIVPHPRTSSDTGAGTDVAARSTVTPTRTTSDTAAGSDVAARLVVEARAASDTAAGSDVAVRGAAVHPRTAADTAAGSDAAVRAALPLARTAADTGSGTDAATRSAIAFSRITSDSAAGSDAAATPAGVSRTTSDVSNGSDAALRSALTVVRTTTDIVAGTDAAARSALVFVRTTSNIAAGSDVAARSNVQFIRTTADTAAGTAVTVRGVVDLRTTSDTAAGTDSTVRVAQAFTRTAADTGSGSDVATIPGASNRGGSDAATGTDIAVRVVLLARITADTAAGSDLAVQRRGLARVAVDIAAGVDTILRLAGLGRTAADAAAVTDVATRIVIGRVFDLDLHYGLLSHRWQMGEPIGRWTFSPAASRWQMGWW